MANGRPSLKCAICVKHGDPGAHTAFGVRGEGGRDLQVGSIRSHSASRAHKQALKNEATAEAAKEKQATLTREALAARDAADAVPELRMVDDVVRAFAEHIGRSNVHCQKFKNLQQILCQTNLEAQGIHSVRWLSGGEAVNWLLEVLPAAIVVLKEYKKELYEVVTSFKFHWLLQFLADVLWELNHLNQRFQQRQIDVTLVAHIVQQTRMRLKSRYFNRDPGSHFGAGEKMQLPDFIKKHQSMDKREMRAEGVDADGSPVSFVYTLHERPLPGHNTDGDVTACFELSLKFVRVVDAELEWRMRDLHLLDGTKLFRTTSYIFDDAKRIEAFKKWLGKLHKLYNHKLPA
ncbi:unnamed protein product [Closterium sp. Naga37s-1]|nr:unnamed protein product [Closterium sp. Naga37s-1]